MQGGQNRTNGWGDIYPGARYTPDEVEFMLAMDRYKRVNRRPFPTWHEVLGVLVSLGYRKVPAEGE